ncbi:hypothetical protein BLOT_002265 [Blomia tropicalis]|nr:hypothetical protein BLOT_002265 [Blomia tropicalis]
MSGPSEENILNLFLKLISFFQYILFKMFQFDYNLPNITNVVVIIEMSMYDKDGDKDGVKSKEFCMLSTTSNFRMTSSPGKKWIVSLHILIDGKKSKGKIVKLNHSGMSSIKRVFLRCHHHHTPFISSFS